MDQLKKMVQPSIRQKSEKKTFVKNKTSKIDKIKFSAINVISQKGISNTSVLDIAEDAGVSVGYLYRYYPGKKELINDVIFSIYNYILLKIEQLLNDNNDIDSITEEIIGYYFKIYKKSPATIKFLVMIVNDFSFDATENQKDYLKDICIRFYQRCKEVDHVCKDLSIEQAYMALLTLPIQSLSMELRGISFRKRTVKENKERIKNLSLMLLKD